MVNEIREKELKQKKSIKYPSVEIGDFLKIAQEQFEQGRNLAYIPLWGDPDRIRNFAGIWLERVQMTSHTVYKVDLTGRLLGTPVETQTQTFGSAQEALERILIIWNSYKFPA